MMGLLSRSLSDMLFSSPIKTDHPPNDQPDEYRDLDFDIYEYDEKQDTKYNSVKRKQSTAASFLNFNSYDWAFSFRESAKSDQKVVLQVSVERRPKEPIAQSYETCCLPVTPPISPNHTGSMTLLRGSSTASAQHKTPTFTETQDLISEEEQNMIMAAIIASQCDDFERQIPRHVREEMEHAAYIAALEESKELASASEKRSASPTPAPAVATPPATPLRSSTFTATAPSRGFQAPAPPTPTSPPLRRTLVRSQTDIPWTSSKGEQVEGESEKQAKFRELLQFHAIAAASIANASARTGISNISGNGDATDYDWVG
ncbi:hypothetical protein AOL_s00110g77 [Orbilia oligospora ATCC 24927]|uniref:Uncharacterized protein n=1 Tax=Arthrobotrys oligospora (strain ATCC 24927 / CBS 115.81 / DSM 1491) TaxID=756982 RepID=G1XKQ7_ARTOA|nr:hypothetical protein AOL_s00110g77 [Orbilia oligospora ATCC 24927]EGX46253.1 hypothetical protein AOL_s00110g77 [Orbilia oligospora ATCC 24927]